MLTEQQVSPTTGLIFIFASHPKTGERLIAIEHKGAIAMIEGYRVQSQERKGIWQWRFLDIDKDSFRASEKRAIRKGRPVKSVGHKASLGAYAKRTKR